MALMLATQPAVELERALGDPWNHASPISFRSLVEHDEREEAPAHAFHVLRDAGAHAHLVPAAFGGRLTSFEELLSLVRVLSRRDLVLTTGLGSTMLAAIPVWAWGDDVQRRTVAKRLLDSGAFGCFAVSERQAGSDLQATITCAEANDGGYLVRGEKWLIGNASRCSFVVALVRTKPALSLLLIDPNRLPQRTFRRLPRIHTLGLRGHDMGGMVFEDTPVPSSALLGRIGRGMEMALTTLQFTRTMIGGMALGAADTALRLAAGWGQERRLYGEPILAIPAVRALLLASFLDLLIGECVATVTARALTLAPHRTSLWAAVTKYLVPSLCERVVRDASIVLSARSYLREGIADGIFQKIARDIAITSIFEGTQLVQLALITSQLALMHSGRRDHESVDLQLLCDLDAPATAWDAPSTRLRIADSGGDEFVQRWFGPGAAAIGGMPAAPRAAAAVASLRAHADLVRNALAAKPIPGDPSLARRFCILHAAACCLQVWHTNRRSLSPEAAGGEWLTLCLERLAFGSELTVGSPVSRDGSAEGDLETPVVNWMLGQLDRGELFSIMPFELAR